ncbi:MAG TPA: S49 family peptidase [Salinivirgaceae bacterium]|nr:S49 family peptidase [Salinivirgaceae bacterium]
MKTFFPFLISLIVILSSAPIYANSKSDTSRVYIFELMEDITPASWRKTQSAMLEAKQWQADLIIIHLNTYGGQLNAADSIRTAILNSPIPVWVFIDNNAASAGALISIAAQKIFMKPGGSIGSATVVDQKGEPLPDKYQSFMRSLMRSTAEAHGGDTVINGNDTVFVWKRDPKIAEAMVDPDIYIELISENGKVLAFTTQEAIRHGYCDGEMKSIDKIIETQVPSPYVKKTQIISTLDKIILFFLNPVVQGILIMLIIAGIYFELQTPGIGFPIGLAIFATLLYFLPLIIEGIAGNWEIIVFIIGVILLAVEIFAIPGFGIIGISGIILMIVGLVFASIDSMEFQNPSMALKNILQSLSLVVLSATVSLILSIWLGGKLIKSRTLSMLTLSTEETTNEGYIGIDQTILNLAGATGIAVCDLRPSGIVEIENRQYDAIAKNGFIPRGTNIVVEKTYMGQLVVKPK